MTKESAYIYWLASSGISFKTYNQLIKEFSDISYIFNNPHLINNTKYINEKQKISLKKRADKNLINAEIKSLFSEKIGIITLVDDKYPDRLKNITKPPLMLYYKGDVKILSNKSISVVGTRSCSRVSYKNTFDICKELSNNGITIVSGIANGIDSAALNGALSGKTPCISVLGNGINIKYPAENVELYNTISNSGLLLSEYSPTTPPYASNFPNRNRIISGLSPGIFIPHAPLKSGASITLNHALDENKDVFAMPGNINEEGSSLPNLLISEGAITVTSARDIMDFYGWDMFKTIPKEKNITCKLDFCEQQLYTLLKQGELSIDDLARLTDTSVSKVSLTLINMEMNGIIVRLPGNIFGLNT